MSLNGIPWTWDQPPPPVTGPSRPRILHQFYPSHIFYDLWWQTAHYREPPPPPGQAYFYVVIMKVELNDAEGRRMNCNPALPVEISATYEASFARFSSPYVANEWAMIEFYVLTATHRPFIDISRFSSQMMYGGISLTAMFNRNCFYNVRVVRRLVFVPQARLTEWYWPNLMSGR
ncbi:hypothetical protein GGR55DRAFT_676117 [Xylaria sp. FL0064]|nr:hypothetical protein GGR55DRAFT_676117 [Xylaria sp. FL0064]